MDAFALIFHPPRPGLRLRKSRIAV